MSFMCIQVQGDVTLRHAQSGNHPLSQGTLFTMSAFRGTSASSRKALTNPRDVASEIKRVARPASAILSSHDQEKWTRVRAAWRRTMKSCTCLEVSRMVLHAEEGCVVIIRAPSARPSCSRC